MIADLSTIHIILIFVFAAALLIQLYFYLYLFVRVLILKHDIENENNTSLLPVSVIIAAKNEAANLKKNLPAILTQDYPEFEVIVVCDHTTDNSFDILQEFQKSYPNLRILKFDSLESGKKAALTMAINESSHDKLVFIDADCWPLKKSWLKIIVSKITNEKYLVLGLGMYESTGSFSNAFIRYDTQIIALQYFAAALTGKPYMGVGRNIAYTKQLWTAVEGFKKHENLLSGDDDLFVSEAGTSQNTAICTNPNSMTLSTAKQNLKEYLNQKARHISTSSKYSLRSLAFSGAEMLTRSLLLLSGIFLLNSYVFIPVLILIGVRLTISCFVIRYNSAKNNNKISIPRIIIFDIFAPFFYGFLFFYKLLIYNSKQW